MPIKKVSFLNFGENNYLYRLGRIKVTLSMLLWQLGELLEAKLRSIRVDLLVMEFVHSKAIILKKH